MSALTCWLTRQGPPSHRDVGHGPYQHHLQLVQGKRHLRNPEGAGVTAVSEIDFPSAFSPKVFSRRTLPSKELYVTFCV